MDRVGDGGYVLGGDGCWWVAVSIFWKVVGGGGWWWVYFGWWWVVVNWLWKMGSLGEVVGSDEFLLGGDGWQ